MISIFLRGNFASNQFETRDCHIKRQFNNKAKICDVCWLRKHPADIRGMTTERTPSARQIDDVDGDGGQGQAFRVKVQDDKSKKVVPL